MDRLTVHRRLLELGYTEKHVHNLVEAEEDKREEAKEHLFKEETEELLRSMDL